jgi:hypothetical protein
MRKLLILAMAAVFTFGGVLAAQDTKGKDKAAPQSQTEQEKQKKADEKSAKKTSDAPAAPAAPAEKAAPKK